MILIWLSCFEMTSVPYEQNFSLEQRLYLQYPILNRNFGICFINSNIKWPSMICLSLFKRFWADSFKIVNNPISRPVGSAEGKDWKKY